MLKLTKIMLCIISISTISAQGNDMTHPPKANKQSYIINENGQTREDFYHWLNQRDNPEVLAYLNAENAYTQSKMQATVVLQEKIYQEFKARIKQDDSTVPYKDGQYYYYTRYEKNKTYPLYCRKKNDLHHPEEIILDVNQLAKDHNYYDVGRLEISPNGNLLAFAEDTQGRRQYKINIKDLTTGQTLKESIVDTTPSMEWANDSNTLFYAKQDPISLRSYRIYSHKLGFPAEKDKLVYEEKDNTYQTEILKTKSKQFLMIGSFKKNTSEYQIVEANHPEKAFRIFSPRQEGREYYLDHHQDKFLIRTNDNAPNFKLMQCDLNNTAFQYWQPFIAYNPEFYFENFQVFDHFLSLEERKQGLIQIKIHPFNQREKPYTLKLDEPDYMASVEETPEMSSHEIRFIFSSLKTPTSVFDFDMQTKHKILKKQEIILGGFNAKNYQSQRVFAKTKDGVNIPISVVYRKDKFKPSTNPLLLEGYGSYGITDDPSFDPYIISLLDRGFVYAIAHIRGGGDLGKEWYNQGKLLNKKNTFTDFIETAEYLQKNGFADQHKMYAIGGSAGGLLMGAVMNMRPDLFNGIIAQVPFVDLMNTMMDPNIPLTTGEYVEWGNPNDKVYYDYMLSYSPYDNVHAANYPNLLVMASYHDSQVQYWEPAKWVAKLRELKTDNHLLLLRTTMTAGHSGVSGRYERYREKAFVYAFLLSLEFN